MVHALEPFVGSCVDGWPIRHIGDIDGQLSDVAQRAAGLLHPVLDVFASLMRLNSCVAFFDQSSVEQGADLALHENEIATGADRLRIFGHCLIAGVVDVDVLAWKRSSSLA